MTTTLSHCQCATRTHQQWTQAWEELQSATYSILRGQEASKEHSMAQYRLAPSRELHRSRLINLPRGPDPHDHECEAGKCPNAAVRTNAGGIYQYLLEQTDGLYDTEHQAASRFHLALYSDWCDEQRGYTATGERQFWQILMRARRVVKAYRSAQNGELNGRFQETVLYAIGEQVRALERGSDPRQAIAQVGAAVIDKEWNDEIVLAMLTALELHAAQLQEEWIALHLRPSAGISPAKHDSATTSPEKKR